MTELGSFFFLRPKRLEVVLHPATEVGRGGAVLKWDDPLGLEAWVRELPWNMFPLRIDWGAWGALGRSVGYAPTDMALLLGLFGLSGA